jgi:hypothetical protein
MSMITTMQEVAEAFHCIDSSTTMNGFANVEQAKADPNINLKKAKVYAEKAKLLAEMADMEVRVYEMVAFVHEKVAFIQKIQGEIDGEAEALTASIAALRKEQETLEAGLRRVEENKHNFVMAVKMDNGDIDKVNLRKAELEIMKLKAPIVEKEIQVMEAEMQLKAHHEEKTPGSAELVEALEDLDNVREELLGFKTQFEEKLTNFNAQYGDSAGLANGLESDSESAKKIHALKEKIKQLMPLWYIGHATRNRFLEGEMRSINNQAVNREVELKSQEAWKFGKIIADASMYLEFTENRRGAVEEFERIYGVTADLAWEHRQFEAFVNIIG